MAVSDSSLPMFVWSRYVCDLFRRVAREGPLLCVVDDAHRLDEPSLDVLAFVARRVRDARIGVLFAPLGQEASREIAWTVVPAPDVSAAVAESAKGNPRALMDLWPRR